MSSFALDRAISACHLASSATMHVYEQIQYDGSVEAVYTMLCDARFRAAVCEATYALRHAVSVDVDGDGVLVTIERVMPADVPPAIRRFIGDEIAIVQTEAWYPGDGLSRRADVTMRIPGKPASMSGTIALESDNGGCRQTFDGDVRVSVPFAGARIEAAIADAIRFAISKESELGQRYLS
jgi:hypothetical protein